MIKPDFERAITYIFARMDRELSPQLYYHSLKHSRDDVLPAAERLGRATAIDDEAMIILKTASAFHDSGFLHTYAHHETASIAIVSEILPSYGFSPKQIVIVCGLINATRLPQRPKGLLEELMCDADLDLLGREDFMDLNSILLQERRIHDNAPLTKAAWLTDQIEFMENHRFFTKAAIQSRRIGKMKNLALMKAALASLNGSSS